MNENKRPNQDKKDQHMNKSNPNLSEQGHEFIAAVNDLLEDWHNRPLVASHGTNSIGARLRGLAADLLRLLDSADERGWETYDLIYEVCYDNDITTTIDRVRWSEGDRKFFAKVTRDLKAIWWGVVAMAMYFVIKFILTGIAGPGGLRE